MILDTTSTRTFYYILRDTETGEVLTSLRNIGSAHAFLVSIHGDNYSLDCSGASYYEVELVSIGDDLWNKYDQNNTFHASNDMDGQALITWRTFFRAVFGPKLLDSQSLSIVHPSENAFAHHSGPGLHPSDRF